MRVRDAILTGAAVVLLSACSQQRPSTADSPPPARGVERYEATKPLAFVVESGLDVVEVRTRVLASWFEAHGEGLRSLLELADGHDSKGTYALASTYSSLSALVSDLDGQSATYKWSLATVAGEPVVVVKPVSNAFLDRQVPPFDAVDETACDLLKYVTEKATPSGRGMGCILRSRPQFIPGADAFAMKDEKLSLSFTASAAVEDIVLVLIGSLSNPMSLTAFRPGANMPYVWEPTW